MKDSYDLESAFKGFLDSDAGKLLVLKLGDTKQSIRLAEGERIMGYTPVYYLDGKGLHRSTESSAMSAAQSGTPQDIKVSDVTADEVVRAIIDEERHCCVASFMYWLEKYVVEKPAESAQAAA